MKPDEGFSDLIGRIYDCVLDTSRWPDVLREIAEAVNGVTGDLTVVNPIAGTGHMAAFYNWPDDVRELAHSHFHISPTAPLTLTVPLLEPLCSSRDLDIEAFHNSRFWQTCFAGRGYYDYLMVGLSRTVSQVASWGVLGSEERGPFDDDSLELARLLSPHIQRAVQISGVLGFQRIQVGMLRSALDALAAPARIVEPDRTIRFQNSVAQAELENGTVFGEVKGRLVGKTPEALRLLANMPSIELAVVDYAMPSMSGTQFMQVARKQNANLPVVYISGYADPGEIAKEGGALLVKKPYRAPELLRAVNEALSRRTESHHPVYHRHSAGY